MKKILLVLITFSTLEAKDIVFGVVPQQSPLLMMKRWIPITKYLSKETGLNILFKPVSSIPKFEEALYSGNYDIAYMNPYHYVIAHKKVDYEAVVRAEKSIQGILVGKDKLNALTGDTFRGKTFLFPAPKAFAATLLVKYEFKKKFGINIEDHAYKYVNSHDSVYKGIQRDIGDFGGGIVRTFNAIKESTSDDSLKILYKTQVYPSHPIALGKGLSEKEKKSIEQALLSIPENLLEELHMHTIIKTDNSEYDSIKMLAEELGIY